MKLSRSIILSTTLHLLFLVLVSFGAVTNDGSKGDGPERFKGVEVSTVIEKDKPIDIDVVYQEPKEAEVTIPKLPKTVPVDKDCPDKWYGGVGIELTYTPQGERIDRVYKGYAADRAGLQIGDLIVAVSEKEILGEPGTPLDLLINRDGQSIMTHVIRSKVCY